MEAVQAVVVPSSAALPVAQELSAAALVAPVAVVQEQEAPEQVAAQEQVAVAVVQEQAAAPEQVAAGVHRMAAWGCSTESP
jgi:hypothetical protein